VRGGLRWILPGLAIAYLLLALVAPLALELAKSFDASPPWQGYATVLTSPVLTYVFLKTLLLAGATTAITAVIAFPVAYALTLMPSRARAILLPALMFPYITSLLVRTYAWMGLLGRNGPVAAILAVVGHPDVSLIDTSWAILAVLVHVFLPFMILSTYVSMRSIDTTQLRAAETLGAKPLEAFWAVYVPQTLPGLLAGAVLTFAISAGAYAIPALIGGPSSTTIGVLVVVFVTSVYNVPHAVPVALAVLLCLFVLAIVAVGIRLAGVEAVLAGRPGAGVAARAGTRNKRGPGRRIFSRLISLLPTPPGNLHLIVAVATIAAILIEDTPFLYLIGASLQPLPLLMFPTTSISFRWYGQVLQDPTWIDAATNSLRIGLLSTVIAVIVGGYLAAATIRGSKRLATSIMSVAILPLVLPYVMYAIGVYDVFVRLNWVGNWWAIALAHSALAWPFAYVNILAGLSAYDVRLDAAASSLGAGPLRRLWRVTFPILRPAIIAGALLAMLLSVDELVVTLFLAGVAFKTLPLVFFADAHEDISPALAVVGVLLVAVTVLVALVALAVLERSRRRMKIGEVAIG